MDWQGSTQFEHAHRHTEREKANCIVAFVLSRRRRRQKRRSNTFPLFVDLPGSFYLPHLWNIQWKELVSCREKRKKWMNFMFHYFL
jgi:hypothetical protein